MNVFRQLFDTGMSGWHSGKGHKHTRKGNFEEALRQYSLALQYSDPEGNDAVLLECLARTQGRLENYEQALRNAEKSLSLYQVHSGDEFYNKCIKRVTEFIGILKSKDKSAINNFLII